MEKILKAVDKATDIVCVSLISGAFIITILHVVGRYILRAPIFFSEELARMFFIWTVMLGASIVNRKDEHTNVTFFISKFSEKFQTILYVAREIIIIFILATTIYYGIVLSYTMRTVKTSALDWSWAFIYISLPIGSLLMILTTIRLIVQKTKNNSGGPQ
ncbi:MAG: TRAP transporter small permease [Spirochaetales bacterium]|jgi:TRAP-type C4-dicarboxylate transport system permease small subunit|nr:TRAP transporter small permease [Spirochaetales bacterium]